MAKESYKASKDFKIYDRNENGVNIAQNDVLTFDIEKSPVVVISQSAIVKWETLEFELTQNMAKNLINNGQLIKA